MREDLKALVEKARALGFVVDESSQDSDVLLTRPCALTPDCGGNEQVRLPNTRTRCATCGEERHVFGVVAAPALVPVVADPSPLPAPVEDPAPSALDGSLPLRTAPATPSFDTLLEPNPEAVLAEAEPPAASTHRSASLGQRLVLTPLALLFLVAGLAAAALSGFANYHAFAGMVDDPWQARAWGWTGVIASVCSFGGFTFFWWHAAEKRRGEAVRSLLFALAGAGTSIVGTQLYIASAEADAAAYSARAEAARPALEAQIGTWREQLAAIPAEVRSVEGLEAYIAEVERVGRTHQKPYRDAKNELGLARRRAELESKIEGATADLISADSVAVQTDRPRAPGWFFASMLELFSSQGTSIGTVALLLLFGRTRA
ncbi:MAG: hypothetical protein AAFQ85_02770 [Pseudomonadota bacterium]